MDENFYKRLLATFKIEALEHLHVISSSIVSYEKSTGGNERADLIEIIYRSAHSLKGAARAVSFFEMEGMCKNLEYIFAALKKNEITQSQEIFDLIHKSLNALENFINSEEGEERAQYREEIIFLTGRLSMLPSVPGGNAIEETGLFAMNDAAETPEEETQSGQINVGNLNAEPLAKTPVSNRRPAAAKAPDKQPAMLQEIVRVAASRLDSLFIQSEQLLSARLTSEQTARELNHIREGFELWRREWNKVNASYKKIKSQNEKTKTRESQKAGDDEKLLNFIEWNLDFLSGMQDRIKKLTRFTQQGNRAFVTMVNELMENVKEVLMLPLSNLLDLFPKLVRDLSRDLMKEVSLEIMGSEIQIDRRILEEMRDPLIHLVRNAIDHGIEHPAERSRKKKNPQGRLSISVSKLEGNKLEILVEDDGRGIDTRKIKKTALSKGIITLEEMEALNQQDTLSLIFHSGFSTSSVITDISGHGLGLAIVKERVEKLGGVVGIDTRLDGGTAFRLQLPHTLATFRGIIVGCSERLFVIPASNMEQAIRVKRSSIMTVENKDTILVNKIPVSLVYLSDMLGLHKKELPREDVFLNVALLFSSEKRTAFVVDEIFYEQEVLIKQFNKQIARLKNISSATILGDGKVVPVLNPHDLIKSAERHSFSVQAGAQTEKKASSVTGNILVVDDSITSRMLLKDIIESSGYNVKTAIDGIDALTAMKTEAFDLVVSDIEMPRMDGFELTRIIRNEEKFSAIPVILVTALSKREDREKGIDAGANAYIVKSSFDQSNLVETIKRLL